MIDVSSSSYIVLNIRDDSIEHFREIVQEVSRYRKRAGYFKRLSMSSDAWKLVNDLNSVFNPEKIGAVTNYEQRLEPTDSMEDFD